jgi:hypothetical protein
MTTLEMELNSIPVAKGLFEGPHCKVEAKSIDFKSVCSERNMQKNNMEPHEEGLFLGHLLPNEHFSFEDPRHYERQCLPSRSVKTWAAAPISAQVD